MGAGPKWTQQADLLLRQIYPGRSNAEIARMMGRSYSAIKNRAATLSLKKNPEYLEREKPGCFRPGQKSWNKGLSYRPGGRVAESQFKPGLVPHNWLPVGAEVEDKDGYLKRKITDDPSLTSRFNWKYVHLIKWEEYHGRPVPPKHMVRFRDGDSRNFSRENLALLTMGENAILNKFFAMKNPPEGGFDVLLNLARIKIATSKRKKGMAA